MLVILVCGVRPLLSGIISRDYVLLWRLVSAFVHGNFISSLTCGTSTFHVELFSCGMHLARHFNLVSIQKYLKVYLVLLICFCMCLVITVDLLDVLSVRVYAIL